MATAKEVQAWVDLAKQGKSDPIFKKYLSGIDTIIDRLVAKGEAWLKANAEKAKQTASDLIAKIEKTVKGLETLKLLNKEQPEMLAKIEKTIQGLATLKKLNNK